MSIERQHTIQSSFAYKTSIFRNIRSNLKDLKDTFVKRGYPSKILDHHFERAMSEDQKILLENKEKASTQGNLPLVLTFNKTLLNIKNVINIGIFYLSMKIYEKFLIKDHSLRIEEIYICTN